MTMKNKYIYILAEVTPIPINYLLFIYFDQVAGLLFLALYVFMYRSFIDSKRLYDLGKITKSEYKKWMIPFYKSYWYPVTHFKELYL